jgi:hypothetical protein
MGRVYDDDGMVECHFYSRPDTSEQIITLNSIGLIKLLLCWDVGRNRLVFSSNNPLNGWVCHGCCGWREDILRENEKWWGHKKLAGRTRSSQVSYHTLNSWQHHYVFARVIRRHFRHWRNKHVKLPGHRSTYDHLSDRACRGHESDYRSMSREITS